MPNAKEAMEPQSFGMVQVLSEEQTQRSIAISLKRLADYAEWYLKHEYGDPNVPVEES